MLKNFYVTCCFADQNFTDFTKAIQLLSGQTDSVKIPKHIDSLVAYVEAGSATGRPDQVVPYVIFSRAKSIFTCSAGNQESEPEDESMLESKQPKSSANTNPSLHCGVESSRLPSTLKTLTTCPVSISF